MRIRYFFFLMTCFVSITALAQESIIGDIDNDLLAKYIALAKQNFPRVKAFHAREDRAKYMANAASMGWFDIINVGYYYYPNSSSKGVGGNVSPGGQIVTNGFMVGVSANIGALLSRPSTVKAAKAEVKSAKAETEEYDITLASDVRAKYYDYLSSKKQLAIRNLAAQSLKGIQADAQQKYERGEIAIDAYTTAKNSATEADAQALTAEVTYLKAKDALEGVIGAKLESIK
ncbi:TolC family protein [Niabella ginsenosidivorans]|nr:TolC family protein [Niabella ginsenosidivorans]